MKELSIAEKAKRYDKVLEELRGLLEGVREEKCDIMEEDIIEIFPELKESGDERMIKFIKQQLFNIKKTITENYELDAKLTKAIDWLEKQGDNPTPINIDKMVMEYSQTKDSDFGMPVNCMIRAYRKGIIDVLNLSSCIEKQNEQNHANSTKTCEDEQKSTDKVKPKFHKGEWVTNGIETVQITGYDIDYGYQVDYKGNLQHRDTDIIEKDYHRWTIQDAKDGDVLVDKDNNIGIYKEIEGIYWDSYIYLGCDGKLYDFSVGGMHDQTQTHPATKGQRDKLLKAMAEAGWDFDFEKKELKKIKPIDEYEGLTDFERTVADVCIGFIGKELGWKQYVKDNAENLLKIAVKKFNAVQPKPVWSEDDEGICRAIINDIANDKSMCKFAISKGICDEQINWLKSLKERVACEANCTTTKEWKPSDEQVKELEFFISDLPKCSVTAQKIVKKGKDTLVSLLSDLKKLKEE